MKARCGVAAAATVIVVGVVVAGCGSSPSPKASPAISHDPGQAGVSVALFQSPERATLSWFSAVNHKDKAAAVAHFAPGRLQPIPRVAGLIGTVRNCQPIGQGLPCGNPAVTCHDYLLGGAENASCRGMQPLVVT
jgi:hypothetical protein